MNRITLIMGTVLMLTACATTDTVTDNNTDAPRENAGNVGVACREHEDCVTPMAYLTRSICPFTSMCVEGRCAVVCPMMTHDPAPNPSQSYPIACVVDGDCDCSGYVAEDRARCACVDNVCVEVVKE